VAVAVAVTVAVTVAVAVAVAVAEEDTYLRKKTHWIRCTSKYRSSFIITVPLKTIKHTP